MTESVLPSSLPALTAPDMLRHLFDDFEHAAVRYCVVGDARDLPDGIRSDIDIVVDPEVLPRIPALLARFGAMHGARLVQALQHEAIAWQYVLAWRGPDHALCFLQVDVCSDYIRHGRRFLAARELLARRLHCADPARRSMGFFVAAPADEFIYYLIKKIDKGQFTDRHARHLTMRWHEDPEGARRQLLRFWPPAQAALLADAAQRGDWQPVRDALPSLRRALHRGRRRLRDTAATLGRLVRRVRQPTGLFVAFLGADGSGKSSVIRGVHAQLAPVFRQAYAPHFRPRLRAGGIRDGAPITNPHHAAPRGPWSSTAKLAFYVLMYATGYLRQIRPRLVRSTLVTFDRYYDDLCVDARRYRYGGPHRLLTWFHALVPAPALLFVLDAPTPILYRRKPEVAPSALARLRAAYRAWGAHRANGHLIDAAVPLPHVIDQVTDRILHHMATRTAQRLHLTEGSP